MTLLSVCLFVCLFVVVWICVDVSFLFFFLVCPGVYSLCSLFLLHVSVLLCVSLFGLSVLVSAFQEQLYLFMFYLFFPPFFQIY